LIFKSKDSGKIRESKKTNGGFLTFEILFCSLILLCAMFKSRIAGTGHFTPERVITNEYLSRLMDTSDAWITERTGIKERRWYEPGVDTVANMAAKASRMALENAGMEASAIDCIVFATITPDYYFPGSGVLLQRELNLGPIPAFDIRNQCTGFVYAVSMADQYIRTGVYQNILVVGAEIQSSALDISTEGRGMAVIFGDGAGALLMKRSEEKDRGLIDSLLFSDGRFAEELILKDPGSSRPFRHMADLALHPEETKPYMNGNQVFKHAVQRFPEVTLAILEKNGFSQTDLDLLVPHQANLRITQYVKDKLGLPDEKVVSNIEKYGNTTAASIPIALSEAWQAGRIKEGMLICLTAFGSGFTWGSNLMRW
jgi:3-oxoacyl-[acyl-carrier-protein] synthase-3